MNPIPTGAPEASYNLGAFPTDAMQVLVAENGPKCGRCAKPSDPRLAGTSAGCCCPRYWTGEEGDKPALSPQQRQTAALELIARCLEAFCKHHKIEIAPAAEIAEPNLTPTGIAAIDGMRAQDKARKAS